MHLHISLPPALENRLQQEIASGVYADASEVIQDALCVFLTPPEVEQSIAAEMRRRVAELERGDVECQDMDSFFDEIFAWLDALPDSA